MCEQNVSYLSKHSELKSNSLNTSLVVASLDKMLHDDYLCLVESGKQQTKEVRRKFKRKTWKQRQLLSESGFVLRIAPPSLSRDRRIKMKKSIKKIKKHNLPENYSKSTKIAITQWRIKEGGGRSGLKPGVPQIYIVLKVFFLTKNIFDFKKGLHLQKLPKLLKFWR